MLARLSATLFFSILTVGLCASAGGQTVDSASLQPPSGDSVGSLPDAPLPQTGQTGSKAVGQTAKAEDSDEVTVRGTPGNILRDQAAIWTSPVRLRAGDLEWFLPLAAATGAAIATDRSAMTHVVSKDPGFNQKNIDVSNALIGGFIAAPVALFGYGHFRQIPRAHEAGILSAEAMIDGVVVEQGMKLMFWRERPDVDSARGKFFQTGAGIDSSFPSSHSVVAWSAAAVLAGEYPSRLSQLLIYSGAAGVSLTRVMGQQHFPSDVVVGSAAGWLVGHYVFRKHHKLSLDTSDEN
ncbi:MAG TPA: phosphatase PAP2 family protein [Terracidiphilus sp.]|nr:phosphatase PAP2 family protein [Terracidiphilus sp.]